MNEDSFRSRRYKEERDESYSKIANKEKLTKSEIRIYKMYKHMEKKRKYSVAKFKNSISYNIRSNSIWNEFRRSIGEL